MRQHFDATQTLEALPQAAIEKLMLEAAQGWRMPLLPDYLGIARDLWLILPRTFPDQPPAAYVQPGAFLRWPHVEADGRLCLWVSQLEPIAHSPEEQVRRCLSRVGEILALVGSDESANERDKEFAREWISYWAQDAKDSSRAAGSALLLSPPPAHATTLRACLVPGGTNRPSRLLIADEETAIRNWLKALGEADKSPTINAAVVYAPLARAPIGAPRDLDEVRKLLAKSEPHALEAFAAQMHQTEPAPFWVVFGVRNENRSSIAALQIAPNPPAGFRVAGERDHKRKQREWQRVAAHAWRVRIQSIERADPAWVHGREFDPDATVLRSKHVALVGCGSLGGLVAEAIAHSGVGRLTLIDPESLEAANLGRHVLSATSLGQKKAIALAEHLRAQLPHLEVRGISMTVEDAKAAAALQEVDLVISTAADWPAERFLVRQTHGRTIPLLLSWAEPHALVGHSALSSAGDDRLLGLFDVDGRSSRKMTQWPEEAWPLPGCAASHQPGTYNRLQRIAGMIVEHAIDALLSADRTEEQRVWLGDSATLNRLGGSWTTPAAAPLGIRERVVALPLPHVR